MMLAEDGIIKRQKFILGGGVSLDDGQFREGQAVLNRAACFGA